MGLFSVKALTNCHEIIWNQRNWFKGKANLMIKDLLFISCFKMTVILWYFHTVAVKCLDRLVLHFKSMYKVQRRSDAMCKDFSISLAFKNNSCFVSLFRSYVKTLWSIVMQFGINILLVQWRRDVYVGVLNFPPISKWQPFCRSFCSYGQRPCPILMKFGFFYIFVNPHNFLNLVSSNRISKNFQFIVVSSF